ncbi:glucosamine 6-phosphate n-acetyltransferase [Quercus suber]|uniref:Glucosamine 6-phosphate N-acetyltransferase n=1 Tax=Quercus suber TaxID=58331 RepID=A0AAW0L800_QUESU
MGVEDNVTSRSLPDFDVVNSTVGGDNKLGNGGGGSARLKKFSSKELKYFRKKMHANNSSSEEQKFQVRKLQISDKNKGFIQLLSALGDDHIISVVEDESPGKIIATGSIFMEKKFLRNCGKVGHIEDVVVDSNARGLKLGKKIIAFLTEHARLMGCYKVILDCSLENKAFYEKCGFKQKDIQMIKYFIAVLPCSSFISNWAFKLYAIPQL